MNIQTIKTNIESVDKIFHIADIHVRNLKRHSEYKQVFKRLYSYIRKNKTRNSIIYVAGDIVHSKTDISPELVSVVGDFFVQLANICPVIIIPGNHDCNLNNKHRLDALSPIIQAINNPNIHYWVDTGIYNFSNITFNVMGVFDSPADFIRASDFEGEIKIALHHGALNLAQTEQGVQIHNINVPLELFDGHDMVLLGDIHKRQVMQEYSPGKPVIVYPGSLVQQNHAETLHSHGLAIWDVNTKTCDFVDIPNDFGYVTLNVVGNHLFDWRDEIPKRPRIRLRVQDSDPSSIAEIISDIKSKRKVEEISVQKIRHNQNRDIQDANDSINVRDVEVQNGLIREYLDSQYALDDATLDGIRHINRITNSKLTEIQKSRNILWEPKRFEFSNMFSYGENNTIDFTNMQGLYGLFAANASGKSSLLDALSFCCFDKCSRTTKSIHVLNNKRNSFSCKLVFEIAGVEYIIQRKGRKNQQGRVPVIVDFWEVQADGTLQSLNGSERDETNKIIRQYIGEYEDFVITAYSVQNNNSGFIDKSQRERKELLASFLDINIFESLYAVASEEIKETATLLKQANIANYSDKIADLNKTIDTYTNVISKKEIELQEANNLLKELNELLISTSEKLQPVDNSIPKVNDIRIAIADVIEKISDNKRALQSAIDAYESEAKLLPGLQSRLESVDEAALLTAESELITREKEIRELDSKIQQYKSKIEHCESYIGMLDTHEFDPECEFCVKNTFVQQAYDAIEQIPILKSELLEIQNKRGAICDQLDVTVRDKLKVYRELKHEVISLDLRSSKLDNDRLVLVEKGNSLLSELDNLNAQQVAATKQELAVIHNEEIKKQIDELREERNAAQTEFDLLNDYINRINIQLAVARRDLNIAMEGINELKRLEVLYMSYQYYLECVGRNGVPYKLIEQSLPKLEMEINSILHQLVDFSVVLDTDGKNINGYIVYDADNVWPIELTSGMERFISSLAIRASLINISALPRTNFLVIDEGLGNLDGTMLSTIGLMFDYLKTQFQFIMMISHIDSSRDLADKHIELHKHNGYSKLNYS